jgi:hypothetical protein
MDVKFNLSLWETPWQQWSKENILTWQEARERCISNEFDYTNWDQLLTT